MIDEQNRKEQDAESNQAEHASVPPDGHQEGKEDREKRDAVRMAPLHRQIAMIVVIVLVLLGAVTAIKSHTQTRSNVEQGSALNPNQVLVSNAAAAAVELKTGRVVMEAGARVVRTNGVVHFSPYSTINVSPRLVGKVGQVFVAVGDRVHEGQPLLTMVSSDAANAVDTARNADEQLKLTSVSIMTARRQFTMGTPEVQAAQAALIQAREASRFNERQLKLAREQNGIGGFTDKPLTDAQSAVKQTDTQLAQDLKDLTLAQRQHDRTVKLFTIGTAAQQDVDAAEDALGKAKDAVANDREQSRIAHVTVDREQKAYNTKLYANQTIAQAETSLQQALIAERAAATSVRMVKAALLHDLKQAEHDYSAAVADDHAAHSVLSTYDNPSSNGIIVVRAPASGTVTARNVNPGQIVDQTGETPWQMMTIVNSATVYVDAQIYEKDMMGVKVGDRVTVHSDALPAGFSAVGTISYVAPGLDSNTHAMSVRADMNNAAGLLKDGMFVNAAVNMGAVSPFPPTPIVPLTAVVHDGDDDFVFIAAEKGKYDRRKVTLGDQRGEGQVAITRGLSGSETIVTHGALFLGSGGTTAD
jgi:RND family efflux transporter MFP subunit